MLYYGVSFLQKVARVLFVVIVATFLKNLGTTAIAFFTLIIESRVENC